MERILDRWWKKNNRFKLRVHSYLDQCLEPGWYQNRSHLLLQTANKLALPINLLCDISPSPPASPSMNNTILQSIAGILLRELTFECTSQPNPDQVMDYEYRTNHHTVRFFCEKTTQGGKTRDWDIVEHTARGSEYKLLLRLSRTGERCYYHFGTHQVIAHTKESGKAMFLDAVRVALMTHH